MLVKWVCSEKPCLCPWVFQGGDGDDGIGLVLVLEKLEEGDVLLPWEGDVDV